MRHYLTNFSFPLLYNEFHTKEEEGGACIMNST